MCVSSRIPKTILSTQYFMANIVHVQCTFLSDKLKENYKCNHKKHEIHCIDENDGIVLKEIDVDEFAVKLKISRGSPPKVNFREENRQYLESLKDMKGDAIDMSNLIGNKNRVTFVRGIAGMGKSVLAKQLTYCWANGDMYRDFKMCVMFECRDLNDFKYHKGAGVKEYEILDKFLKSKVNCDLGDGDGILFIIDGLDELYDITGNDSVIFHLLNINGKYGMAKIIVTGRPHIEHKLVGYCNMGGLLKVEINGLTEGQIEKYIKKFSSRPDHIQVINKAMPAAHRYLPIMHVPQFLNTFCCVAILTKGKVISNSTELYCWTVYLLLRQHADKQKIREQATVSQVFKRYSKTLIALSEICHDLLIDNKIIFEGCIESQIGETEDEKKFINSLFVDVRDCFSEKYQFKHLSLMEFLSALHICKMERENLLEQLKKNLEKGFVEVVSFVCRLMSGCLSKGIIQEMLKNALGLAKEDVDDIQLLDDVIRVLNECGLDRRTKLSRSFETITYFLNEKFKQKQVIKSIIGKCSSNCFLSDIHTSDNVSKICRHLESCEWTRTDSRKAFENVQFAEFDASTLGPLTCAVKYLTVFETSVDDGIYLLNMRATTTVNEVRVKFNEDDSMWCGRVHIVDCKFRDTEIDKGLDKKLEWLAIRRCTFYNITSFSNLCYWGMSYKWFDLDGLDIEVDWWKKLVKAIEKKQKKRQLHTRELFISNCSSEMSNDMKTKVIYCSYSILLSNNSNSHFCHTIHTIIIR